MSDTPSVLVFDVNETLLDIETLRPLFLRLFGDGDVLRDWFAQVLLYSQSATLAGLYRPLGAIGAGVLQMIGETRRIGIGEGDTAELRARLLAMPAHADVLPGLERLRNVGFRLVTLTNSAPDPQVNTIERSGIGRLVEHQFSVDPLRKFKPAPEVYRHVSETLALPPGAFCMVAAHHWDVFGAQVLGWTGALVTRPGQAAVPGLPEPDLVAPDIDQLADIVIRRWR